MGASPPFLRRERPGVIAMDPRSVIFAFGVGSGVLLGFVLGCFGTWLWLSRNHLFRDRTEWRRARAARRAARRASRPDGPGNGA
jgi:hypothetical protein